MNRFRALIVLSIVAVLAAGCSSDGGDVTVEDVWGRPSPMQAGNAAFYMQVTGGEADDTIVSASSTACAVTELHETKMQDGVMSMQERPDGIPVPAESTVSLEPGGLHVMCIDSETFELGDMVTVDLEFAEAGTVTVEAEIREG